MFGSSIHVPETTRNGLQNGLGISHIVISGEGTLCCYIRKGHYGSPLINGIHFTCCAQDLMQREGRDIQCLVIISIIQGIVIQSLPYIGRHTNGMKNKIHLSAQHFHGFVHQVFQVFQAGCVGRDYLRTNFLRQLVDGPHPEGNGCIGQHNFGSFFMSSFGHLPCNGLIVQGTENDSLFPF